VIPGLDYENVNQEETMQPTLATVSTEPTNTTYRLGITTEDTHALILLRLLYKTLKQEKRKQIEDGALGQPVLLNLDYLAEAAEEMLQHTLMGNAPGMLLLEEP
jgi:hypothetical protein